MMHIDVTLRLNSLATVPDGTNYGSLVFLTGAKVLVGVIDDEGRSDYKLVSS